MAGKEPLSVEEALSHPEWKAAMDAEIGAIEWNDRWELVPRPHKRKIIGTKWVYKTKYNSDGSLDKYKARLVARGFT